MEGRAPLIGGTSLSNSMLSAGGLTSVGPTLHSTDLGGRSGQRDRDGLSADIGTIELGSAAISTKFEEEDMEEDSDSVSDWGHYSKT